MNTEQQSNNEAATPPNQGSVSRPTGGAALQSQETLLGLLDAILHPQRQEEPTGNEEAKATAAEKLSTDTGKRAAEAEHRAAEAKRKAESLREQRRMFEAETTRMQEEKLVDAMARLAHTTPTRAAALQSSSQMLKALVEARAKVTAAMHLAEEAEHNASFEKHKAELKREQRRLYEAETARAHGEKIVDAMIQLSLTGKKN